MTYVWQKVGDWRVALAGPELEPLIEPVLASLEDPDAQVIKRGRSREVLYVPLPGGDAAFVKCYLVPGIWTFMTGSRALQEFRNLVRMREMGVAAVEPICCAERERVTVIATRAEPEAATLGERLPAMKEEARLEMARELGRVLHRLHDERFWHRDLHVGNVLTVPRGDTLRLVLVDVQKMRRLAITVPLALRVRDLAALVSGLSGRGSEAPTALLESYVAAGRGPDLAELRERVERSRLRASKRRLRSRGRRCVKNSTGFRVEREARRLIYRRADVESDVVEGLVEAIRGGAGPRIDDVRGGPLRQGSVRPSHGSSEPGAPVVASVAVREFVERWPALRRGRGMHAWRTAHSAMLRGVAVALPLALVEDRLFGFLRRSYLVMRWEEAGETLEHALTEAMLPEAGRFLSRLHTARLSFRDLSLAGLFVRRVSDEAERFVVLHPEDLSRSRRPRSRDRVSDLVRFADAVVRKFPHLSRAEVGDRLGSYGKGGRHAEKTWRAAFSGSA